MKLNTPKNLFKSGRMSSRRWVSALDKDYRGSSTKISRELKVKKRARDNGRDNLPKSDDMALDVVQQHIVDRFEIGADHLKQALWNQLKGAHDLILQRLPEEINPDVVEEKTRLAIARIRDRAANNLIELQMTAQDRFRDLQQFKSENDLTRSAIYPMPRPPLWSIFTILFFLILEMALNASIFAEAAPGYLREGAIQAFMFSLVNIVLGFGFMGLVAMRYSQHHKVWKRTAGILGVIVVLALGIGFNAYVSHYREIIGLIPAEQVDVLAPGSYADALMHLISDPFDLKSWQAIVLFFIGFAIFAGLAVKGYLSFDDVYPGYGRSDRNYKMALRAFEREQELIKKHVEKAIDQSITEVTRMVAAAERMISEARDIAAEAEQAQREADDSIAELARACTDNLRDYRETNDFVRTDAPPAYFKAYPAFAVELPEREAIQNVLQAAIIRRDGNRKTGIVIEKALTRLSETEIREFFDYLSDIGRRADERPTESNNFQVAA